MNGSTLSTDPSSLPIRRNTALLSAAMAVNSAVLQLNAAISSLTFVLVTGFEALLGLGPAIFLTSSALSSVPLGRAMDRYGRIPIVAGGFVLGAIGCALTALATHVESPAALLAGFLLVGVASAGAFLARAAAGDMYPPARRARGISFVLFGAVFGAILGPSLFGPLFAGKEVALDALTVPWLAGAGLMIVAAAIVLNVRPDPRRIAELIATGAGTPEPRTASPLGEILRRPGVVPSLLAALASFGVMVSVMNLTGYVVVDHHHHSQSSVFPIVGAHVVGMFGLVLVVGALIDRIGRTPALAGGLVVMSVSCAGLIAFESVWATAVLLFGLGLGWNVSFVAATAQLADSSGAAERGKLLGFTDLLSGLLGATLALVGGFALDSLGVAALALGAAVLVVLPIAPIVRRRPRPAPVPETP
ncbi:MAG: MFS transporter [Actinomycetota bacterium]|nr:MFS transporter [Actinomycetota bacterium]